MIVFSACSKILYSLLSGRDSLFIRSVSSRILARGCRCCTMTENWWKWTFRAAPAHCPINYFMSWQRAEVWSVCRDKVEAVRRCMHVYDAISKTMSIHPAHNASPVFAEDLRTLLSPGVKASCRYIWRICGYCRRCSIHDDWISSQDYLLSYCKFGFVHARVTHTRLGLVIT